jgi:hypothetical protein
MAMLTSKGENTMGLFFDEPFNDELDEIEKVEEDVDVDFFDPEEYDTSMKEGAEDRGFVKDDFSF